MMMNLKTLLCTLPCLGLLTGCFFEPKIWVKRTVELKLDVKSAVRLSSKTHNGSITSTGDASSKQVLVTAKIQAGALTETEAKVAMAAIEAFCEEKDGTVTVAWRWLGEKKSGWGAKVAFEIRYPAAMSTSFETHNGSVSVLDAAAKTKVVTHNGNISVSRANLSEVLLSTHNGGVSALLSTEGPLSGKITSHNGKITVDLAEGVSTKVRAVTHNGSARCELVATEASAAKSSWSGTLGQGEGALELQTHNGSIVVK